MKTVFLLMILLPSLLLGQQRLADAIRTAEILKKNGPRISIEDQDKRVIIQLTDSTIISAIPGQELLELSIESDFSNFNTFDQIKQLKYKVLSLRPSLSNCDDGTDMNPCTLARHHFLPDNFRLPKSILIFDGVSPFFQRFPDRILIEPTDLRIVTFRKLNHSDLPVALLYQEQLRLVVIERNGMLPAEKVLFDHFAPKLKFEYGTPDWIDGLSINYSHKTIKKVLNRSSKKKSNVEDGTFSLKHKNGNRAVTGTFLNGKADGHWILYNEDGNKVRNRYYLNGLPTGTWEWFDASGNVLYSETYDESNLLESSITYDSSPNSVKFSSLTVLREKDKITTTIKQFFPNGKLKLERSYLGSLLHGYSRAYYDNGQLKEEKLYQFDVVDFSIPALAFSRDGLIMTKQWIDSNGVLYAKYAKGKNKQICKQDSTFFSSYCVTINDRGDTIEVYRYSREKNNIVHLDERLRFNYAGELQEHLIQSDTFNLEATFYNEKMPLKYIARYKDSVVQVNDSTTIRYWKHVRITGEIYGLNGFEYQASKVESYFVTTSITHQVPVTTQVGVENTYTLYSQNPNTSPSEFLSKKGYYDISGKKTGTWHTYDKNGIVIDQIEY